MPKPTFDFDLIVIGSGAGGSAAASLAARAGKKVALIEAATFGGESPNWGDVPLRAMLHAAHLYSEARAGARFGLRSGMVGYNYPLLQNWKELAIKRTGAGGNRSYYDNQGIATIEGMAHFLSPHEVAVGRKRLSSEYFLIATGSHWEQPDIVGLGSIETHTPETILEPTRPPRSILIIGSSGFGIETAQLFSIINTKVYIAEVASRILPGEDSEAGELIARVLTEQKDTVVLTQTRILSVQEDGALKKVTLMRGGTEQTIKVEEIILAGERLPNVDMGLENAHIAYTAKGIEVDEFLQTSSRHIYAAGDILGRPHSFTHTALLESRVAFHNMFNSKKMTPDYHGTPRVVFTVPEIAAVGLSEDDCLRRDLAVNTAFVPLNIVARSNVSDFRDGFIKLITDKHGVLLGGTVVAPGAAEIIHELALAVRLQLPASELANLPHAFLSWSEAVRVAASKIA